MKHKHYNSLAPGEVPPGAFLKIPMPNSSRKEVKRFAMHCKRAKVYWDHSTAERWVLLAFRTKEERVLNEAIFKQQAAEGGRLL